MPSRARFPKGIARDSLLVAVGIYIKLEAVRRVRVVRRLASAVEHIVAWNHLPVPPASSIRQHVPEAEHIGGTHGTPATTGCMSELLDVLICISPVAPA